MIDLKGAAAAATSLVGNKSVVARKVKLPMVAIKAAWDVQAQGVYDLIFPYLHVDYPTRIETLMAISGAVLIHCSTNMHNGEGSTPGTPNSAILPVIPREFKFADGPTVRAGSPINAIGYGV